MHNTRIISCYLITFNKVIYYIVILQFNYGTTIGKLQGDIFFYRAMNFSRLPFAFLVSGDTLSGEVKEGTNRNDLFKAFPRNRNLALCRVRAKKGPTAENVLSREGTKNIGLKIRGKVCSNISKLN